MKISKRIRKGETVLYNITCNKELIDFINNVIQPKVLWLDVGNMLNDIVIPMYKSNETLTYKQWYVTRWSSQVKPYSNQRQLVYWLARGYSELASIEEQKKVQSKGGKAFSKAIKENPDKYIDINPTQLGWWIKKGYTEDEAIKLRSNRQSTFSLDKCIDTYGNELGLIKFNERQIKWQKSQQSSKGITWDDIDKDCRSIEYFKKISKKKALILLAENYMKFSFLTESVKECYNDIIIKHIDAKKKLLHILKESSYTKFSVWANLKPITDYLNMSKNELFEFWLETKPDKYIQTKWGNLYYYKDYYFQSNGEFVIGNFLIKRSIDFSMHKKYPIIGLYMYDFYLPKYDVYIEYCGRDEGSYINKQNILGVEKLNIIWSNDVDEIIKKINSFI